MFVKVEFFAFFLGIDKNLKKLKLLLNSLFF